MWDQILNNWAVALIVVPLILGVILLGTYFVSGWVKSGRGFLEYVSRIDAHYPIKPTTRALYQKMGDIADGQVIVDDRFHKFISEIREIRSEVEAHRKSGASSEVIAELQGKIEALVSEMKEWDEARQRLGTTVIFAPRLHR